MARVVKVVLPVVLILAIAAGVSAAQFNVTVLPFTTSGLYVSLGPGVVRATLSGPMATEVGLSLNDRWELVTGLDYSSYKAEWPAAPSESGSLTAWNVGVRYFLSDDEQLRPFAFGNYGAVVFGGDVAAGTPTLSLMRLGVGAVSPINDRWGVVGQTGVAWFIMDLDSDPKATETSTFTSLGLRYNF